MGPGVLAAIEKAIHEERHRARSRTSTGPSSALNIPPLTEERRKDLVKLVHKRMEEARVEIRNIRREAADELKKEERDGAVGADEAHRQLEQRSRRLTDRFIAEVDRARRRKEQEVLEV